MATTKIYLDKRTLDASGRGTLRLVLFHRNTSTSQSLNIKLRPDEWDGVQIQCKKDKKQLDAIIQKKKSDIDMAIFRMETGGEPMPRTAKEIMLKVHEVLEPEKYKKRGPLFVDVYNAVMDTERPKSRLCYISALNKMKAFDPHLSVRTFEDLDKEWFEKFVKFMEKNMSWNGSRNYLRNIRHVFNYARDENITNNYPFKKLKMGARPTKKRALSLEQIRTLRTMPLAPWQEEYRDMFMLSLYLIGINAIDLLTLKHSQVVDGRLEYIRAKTKFSSMENYSIKIEPEAQELLDKYKGKDWLLSPCDTNTSYLYYAKHMNHALQSLGIQYSASNQRIGGEALFPDLTYYWARHTWSTLAFYIGGYSVDVVGQGLGHQDSRHAVTMTYIKPYQKIVDETNRAVIDAIVGKA